MASNPHRQLSIHPRGWSSVFGSTGQIRVGGNSNGVCVDKDNIIYDLNVKAQ